MTTVPIDATADTVRSSPEDTRVKIINATRELYSYGGSRGTTTREIAERAGVNEATIFRHFGTKHALIAEMHQHFCQAARVKDVVAGLSGDVERDLQTLAIAMAEGLGSNEDLIRMAMAESREPAMLEIVLRRPMVIREILTGYMATQVAAGQLCGEPTALARFFMGMIFSNVIGRRLWADSDVSPADQIVFLVGMFLNGAKAK